MAPIIDPAGGPIAHVVLHEPEIPNNTGNIGRTCVATGAHLHLIHPLGFDLSEKACRRAGLDYWPRLTVHDHTDFTAYRHAEPAGRRWYLTTRTDRSLFEAEFRPGDHLVFGKESAGLPASIIEANPDRTLAIPMAAGERSLNLASAAGIVLYEVVRQCGRR